jgi:uncharacterized protein
MAQHEINIELPGPAGLLEARYQPGPSVDEAVNIRGGAVIVHPHPLYGGNMHNKVVQSCRKVCSDLGLATLRFNFRGVGTSAGSYDDGQGEQEDLRTAIRFMTGKLADLPLYLVGFSFGAWMALKIGTEEKRVTALVGIGTPTGWERLSFMANSPKPKLLIHGTEDQYCDPEELQKDFGLMDDPKQLFWVQGGDHFFTGKLIELEQLLAAHFPFELP